MLQNMPIPTGQQALTETKDYSDEQQTYFFNYIYLLLIYMILMDLTVYGLKKNKPPFYLHFILLYPRKLSKTGNCYTECT